MKFLFFLTLTVLSCFAAINIPFSEFEQDLSNLDNLNWGVDRLLEKGRGAKKIVNNRFDITRVYKVSYEQSENYYDFQIQLDDGKETIILANLSVQVEGGKATSLASFNYYVTTTTIQTIENGTNSGMPHIPPIETDSGTSETPANETDSSAPETPVKSDSDVPQTPVETDSNVPETPVNETETDVSETPETPVKTDSDVPETTPNKTDSETPQTPVDIDLDVPDTPVNETKADAPETDVPETPPNKTDSETQQTPVDVDLDVPEATVDETDSDVPQTPVETEPEIPETPVVEPDSATGQQDQDVQEALDFGVDSVLQAGYKKGKIPNGEDYQVTQINSINQKSQNNKVYYDFDVEVVNAGGNIVIEMTLTVRKNSDGEMKTTAFNYKVTKTTTTIRTTNNTQTTPVNTDSEAPSDQTSEQAPDIQEALDFGFQSVIQTGQNQNKIKTGEDYEVTKINSINKSIANNKVTYQFDVEVANSKGNIVIKMTFTVKKDSDGDMSVTTYNYHVSTTTSGTDDIGPDTEIPPSKYDDPEIREALTFGRDSVLQSGQNKGKIPTGESYYMSNVNSIIQETGDNLVRYKFEITMENTAGNIVIQMKYTVSRSSSGQLKVAAFNYSIQKTTTTTK